MSEKNDVLENDVYRKQAEYTIEIVNENIVKSKINYIEFKNGIDNFNEQFEGICEDIFNGEKNIRINTLDAGNLYGIDENFLMTKRVVAALFKLYRNMLDKDLDKIISFDVQKNLLNKFEKVFKSIRYNTLSLTELFKINSDDLDILSELASTYSVKENIEKLINGFVKILDNQTGRNNYFVILINDFLENDKFKKDIESNLSVKKLIFIAIKK